MATRKDGLILKKTEKQILRIEEMIRYVQAGYEVKKDQIRLENRHFRFRFYSFSSETTMMPRATCMRG